jgi:hypothetical protein
MKKEKERVTNSEILRAVESKKKTRKDKEILKALLENRIDFDESCKTCLQPPSTSRRKDTKPMLRINKSKDKKYVQLKGINSNDWTTLGEATPETLGTAFGILMQEILNRERDKTEDLGRKHQIITDNQSEREFRHASKDEEKIWEGRDKLGETSVENFGKKINREMRAKKRLARYLKIPKPKKEEQKEKDQPTSREA